MKSTSTVLAACVVVSLLGVTSAGCGGAAEVTVQSREVPAADPKAAKKYLEGARLLARPGNYRDRSAIQLFK
jgi:hypothetical protein